MDIWKHGKYLDLWSLVHLLSGFLLGSSFYWLGAGLVMALVLSVLLMVLWEVFELTTKIIEPSTNVTVDIIVGFAGFAVSAVLHYWLVLPFNLPLFAGVLAVTLLLALWGFTDFLKRGYR